MTKATYHDYTQGGTEWVSLRCGKITASNLNKIAPAAKGGFTKAGADYLRDVFASQIRGEDLVKATFANFNALQWGKDNEPYAREAAIKHFGVDIQAVGAYETVEGLIVSPDGVALLDPFSDKLVPVEIKCPYNSARHIDNIINNSVPDEYMLQVQAQIMALESDIGYFVSYDYRNTDAPLHVVLVPRDEALQEKIRTMVVSGYEYIAELRKKYTDNRIALREI